MGGVRPIFPLRKLEFPGQGLEAALLPMTWVCESPRYPHDAEASHVLVFLRRLQRLSPGFCAWTPASWTLSFLPGPRALSSLGSSVTQWMGDGQIRSALSLKSVLGLLVAPVGARSGLCPSLSPALRPRWPSPCWTGQSCVCCSPLLDHLTRPHLSLSLSVTSSDRPLRTY